MLYEHPDWHVSVEAVYQHLLTAHVCVNLSTCYRVLHELCEAGIVEHRALAESRFVYEFAKSSRHDHMVRNDSGQILEFQEPRLDTLLRDIARERGFELVDRQLILYVRSSSETVDEADATGTSPARQSSA